MPILDVDEARGTFAHHCVGEIPLYPGAQVGRRCDVVSRGLSLKRDTRVTQHAGGRYALCVTCGVCGSTEAFNLLLGPEDEDGEQHSHHHREQSRHIRVMMRHPHVGLHALVRDCRCEECAPTRPRTTRKTSKTTTPIRTTTRSATKKNRKSEVAAHGDQPGVPPAGGASDGQ